MIDYFLEESFGAYGQKTKNKFHVRNRNDDEEQATLLFLSRLSVSLGKKERKKLK